MKINDNQTEVLSNVQSQKTSFSISNNTQDTALAIDVITNKGYKNKIQTPVQEYICNARDAHRETKQTRPIEITLPTVFDPTFKVRDFGQGIPPNLMADVFVKFFASTKRRDNHQTGGFGLGAKSAWAYTDSFGIISIVDGVKRSYTAYKSGQGVLQPELEEQTTDHSGLEISIAVNPKDIPDFKKAVIRAVFFWKKEERPVIVNEPDLVKYPSDPVSFGTLVFYKKEDLNNLSEFSNPYGYGYSNVSIILDGILYIGDENDLLKRGQTSINNSNKNISSQHLKKCFLSFNTGEVSVTPFRENLEYNEYTTSQISKTMKDSLKILEQSYNEEKRKSNTIEEKNVFVEKYKNIVEINERIKINPNVELSIRYDDFSYILFSEELEKGKCYSKEDFEMYGYPNSRGEGKISAYSHSFIRCQKNTVFVEYDPTKDLGSFKTVRAKYAQLVKKQEASKEKKNYFLIQFHSKKGTEAKKDLQSVFQFICSSSLTLERPKREKSLVKAVKKTSVRVDVPDRYGAVIELELDSKLKNTYFMYSSEYISNRESVKFLAEILKKQGLKLYCCLKSDEAKLVKMGALKFADHSENIQWSREALLMFLSTEVDFTSYTKQTHFKSLLSIKDSFKNKSIIEYLDLIKEINNLKTSLFDLTQRQFSFSTPKSVEYKNLLTSYKKGSMLISENFYLLDFVLSELSYKSNKQVIEELSFYIKSKEKELKNG